MQALKTYNTNYKDGSSPDGCKDVRNFDGCYPKHFHRMDKTSAGSTGKEKNITSHTSRDEDHQVCSFLFGWKSPEKGELGMENSHEELIVHGARDVRRIFLNVFR